MNARIAIVVVNCACRLCVLCDVPRWWAAVHLFSPLISKAVIAEAHTKWTGRNEFLKNVYRTLKTENAIYSIQTSDRQTIKHYLSLKQSKVNCAARLFYAIKICQHFISFLISQRLHGCHVFGASACWSRRSLSPSLCHLIIYHIFMCDSKTQLTVSPLMMIPSAPSGNRTRENAREMGDGARKQQEQQFLGRYCCCCFHSGSSLHKIWFIIYCANTFYHQCNWIICPQAPTHSRAPKWNEPCEIYTLQSARRHAVNRSVLINLCLCERKKYFWQIFTCAIGLTWGHGIADERSKLCSTASPRLRRTYADAL